LNASSLGLSRLNHADVRVKNGSIELRMANTLMKPDEIAPQNAVLHVRKVESSSEKKNDYLRITLASDSGCTAPLAFELPKGALATMDEAALEQLIAPILTLSGGSAMPPIAPPPPPPDSATASSSAPAGWRVQPSKDGNEAAIAGVSKVNGRQAPAVMALTCTGAEIRVRRNGVPDPQSLVCEGDMDGGNDAVKFSVGERPLEAASICTPEATTPPPAVVKLPIDLGAGGLDEVLASPGSPMVIHIAFTDKPADEFIAQFQLPQDGSAIEFLRSCSATTTSASQTTVDACPVLPGKGLRKAELLTASGKPYNVMDPDNDIGLEWLIPKATKAHPVRPKLTFACYYGGGLKPNDPNEPLEKKLIPISPKATVCTARGDTALGELSATCN
jgi:hypothetical protein